MTIPMIVLVVLCCGLAVTSLTMTLGWLAGRGRQRESKARFDAVFKELQAFVATSSSTRAQITGESAEEATAAVLARILAPMTTNGGTGGWDTLRLLIEELLEAGQGNLNADLLRFSAGNLLKRVVAVKEEFGESEAQERLERVLRQAAKTPFAKAVLRRIQDELERLENWHNARRHPNGKPATT